MLRDDRAHPCDSRSLHLWVLCFLVPRRSRVLDFPTGTITLLFTDIEGSTLLLQQVGEQYSRVLAQCRQVLRTAILLTYLLQQERRPFDISEEQCEIGRAHV